METITCPRGCCKVKVKPYIAPKYSCQKVRRHRRKAGVFIYDPKTDKVLLVQSRGNLWGAPKGTLQYGEDDRQCAVREVKEETGLKISENDFSRAFKIYNVAIYFYLEMSECEVDIQDTIYDNDANGIGWIKLDCLNQFVENGNISLSQHCRIIFSRFHNREFSSPNFILVDRKKKF